MTARILLVNKKNAKDKAQVLEIAARLLPPTTSPRQACEEVAILLGPMVQAKAAPVKDADWLGEIRKAARDTKAAVLEACDVAYKRTLVLPSPVGEPAVLGADA